MLILGYAEAQTKPTPKYGGILRNVETAGAPGSFGWPPEAIGNDALNMRPALEYLVREDKHGNSLSLASNSLESRSRQEVYHLYPKKGSQISRWIRL